MPTCRGNFKNSDCDLDRSSVIPLPDIGFPEAGIANV